MAEDRPLNRRLFFRQGLKELLRPLAQSAGPLEEAIRQLAEIEKPAAPPPPPVAGAAASFSSGGPSPANRIGLGNAWLRPPGALSEQNFRDTCSRCGQCVAVCPAQCIKLDAYGLQGGGVPYIEVDQAPCVLCSGLKCMHSCPTGALQPIPLGQIKMGTAAWHAESCLRTAGENCTICVDQCPVGEVAIVLQEGQVRVLEKGCTGCGVCQHDCPTNPKSITVTPRGAQGAGAPVARRR